MDSYVQRNTSDLPAAQILFGTRDHDDLPYLCPAVANRAEKWVGLLGLARDPGAAAKASDLMTRTIEDPPQDQRGAAATTCIEAKVPCCRTGAAHSWSK